VLNNLLVINPCAAKVTGDTPTEAAAEIPNTRDGVLSWLGLTLTSLLGL
jgi:hypothetical protein